MDPSNWGSGNWVGGLGWVRAQAPFPSWGGSGGCPPAGSFPCRPTPPVPSLCSLGVTSLTTQQSFAGENEIRKISQVFASVLQRRRRPEPALFVRQLARSLGKQPGSWWETPSEITRRICTCLWGPVTLWHGAGGDTG